MRRSSLSKLGRVQGTLAQRGIAVIFVESLLGRVIAERSVAQIGRGCNLSILRSFMITSVAFVGIEKNCKELVV